MPVDFKVIITNKNNNLQVLNYTKETVSMYRKQWHLLKWLWLRSLEEKGPALILSMYINLLSLLRMVRYNINSI